MRPVPAAPGRWGPEPGPSPSEDRGVRSPAEWEPQQRPAVESRGPEGSTWGEWEWGSVGLGSACLCGELLLEVLAVPSREQGHRQPLLYRQIPGWSPGPRLSWRLPRTLPSHSGSCGTLQGGPLTHPPGEGMRPVLSCPSTAHEATEEQQWSSSPCPHPFSPSRGSKPLSYQVSWGKVFNADNAS